MLKYHAAAHLLPADNHKALMVLQ